MALLIICLIGIELNLFTLAIVLIIYELSK
jgi:hypothetical protein